MPPQKSCPVQRIQSYSGQQPTSRALALAPALDPASLAPASLAPAPASLAPASLAPAPAKRQRKLTEKAAASRDI